MSFTGAKRVQTKGANVEMTWILALGCWFVTLVTRGRSRGPGVGGGGGGSRREKKG